MKRYKDYTRAEVEEAVDGAVSTTEVIRRLGLSSANSSYDSVRAIAAQYQIELPIFSTRGRTRASVTRLTHEQLFVYGTMRDGATLKRHMLAIGIIEECSECFIGLVWNGKPLRLEVDHVDGDKFNNRISNLRLLCPNCHTQTPTHSRKSGNYKYCQCGKRMPVDVDSSVCLHTADYSDIVNGIDANLYGIHPCIDCGNDASSKSIRCNPCENIRRVEGGSNLKFDYPTLAVIIENIQEKGYLAYSKELGMSDNSIRKYLIARRVIPLPKRIPKGRKVRSV